MVSSGFKTVLAAHTSHTVRAQYMRTLYLAAARALVQALDVLQSFSGHLTMTLLHV